MLDNCVCTLEQQDHYQILVRNYFVKALLIPELGIGKDLALRFHSGEEKNKAGKVLRVCALLVNQCS